MARRHPCCTASAVSILLFLVALALAGPRPLDAQARARDADASGRLYLTGGLQVVDLDALNARLAGRALPTFGEECALLGLGLDMQHGALLLGVEGSMLVEREESTAGSTRTLGGGALGLRLGYVFQATPRVRVYPLGGIGWTTVAFESVDTDDVFFDDLLEDPGPGATLSTGDVQLQLGGGLDLHVGARTTLGVRAGYAFSPGDSDWEWEDVDVQDGPDVGLEGFFVQGSVGWGRKPGRERGRRR